MFDSIDVKNETDDTKQSQPSKWQTVLVWSFIGSVFFAVLSFNNFSGIKRDTVNAPNQQKTTAIVTHVPQSRESNPKVEYEFIYQGSKYAGIQNASDAPFVKVGQKVDVYFDPVNPLTSSLTDFHELHQQHYLHGVLCMVASIALFAWAILCLTQAFDWKKQSEES